MNGLIVKITMVMWAFLIVILLISRGYKMHNAATREVKNGKRNIRQTTGLSMMIVGLFMFLFLCCGFLLVITSN